MKIADVMKQIGRDFDIPESVIQNAFAFSNAAAGQGKEIKERLDRELTEDEVQAWLDYGRLLILAAIADPEFKKQFYEMVNDQIEKN
jgi:hypothetical protein